MRAVNMTDRPPADNTSSPARGAVAGTATLMRFVLRRDRIHISIWMLAIVGFIAGSAASFGDLFPTAAERQARAELMSSPMMRAFNGPGYGLDDYTLGAMVANELLVLGALAVAIMSILTVVRHTRAEEEAGRAELLRSNPVGVYAAPTAVLLINAAVNLSIGALMAVALRATVAELTGTGAWMFGLSMAAVGIVFAAVAGIAAQVTEHARGATGLAAVALGAAFLLRAVGDAGGVDDRALSWASPIGWAQSTRAFVDERWWPLLLCLTLALLLTAAAYSLADRRDVGAGLVRARPGSPRAPDRLVRPTGLALRLHRGSILAWSAGVAFLGATFGAVIGDIQVFLDDNPQVEEIIGRAEGADLVDSFLATVVLIVVLLAAGNAISAVLRLRSEETQGRAEPLLATPLTRSRWAASHLTIALAGGTGVVLAGSVGLGTAAALNQNDETLLADVLTAGLAYLPAVWLVAGVVVALFGLIPRAVALAWIVLAHAVIVGLLGNVLDLPPAVRNLSPLHHVPDLPAVEIAWGALVALAGIAAALIILGFGAFRRRGVNVT